MRRIALAAGCLLPLIAIARAPAPATGCLDARTLERVRMLDENTLLVDAANGWFVVAHASGCVLGEEAKLLAKEGWACGAGEEFVQDGQTLCPVMSVTRIDGRTFAGLAMAADRRAPAADGTPALEPIEVQARVRRGTGFRGDASYCFSPAAVRGWQLDGRQLVVQTSPRRNAGKKRYRVELGEPCPELAWADAVEFRSGVGVGLICGNAGDRALPLDDGIASGVDDRQPTRGVLRGCSIAAVWPED